VPPRKAFGLWVSEYGFENWHDVDAQRNCPMWTLHLDEIDPDQDVRLTFEKRRDGTITHSNPQQLYRSTGSGGYAGELRGSLY
jgi:hypothetical protein